MLTPWGEALDKNAVLQEYPRPQLVRESYYNLNGLWDYAITASDACPGAYAPPESSAACVLFKLALGPLALARVLLNQM